MFDKIVGVLVLEDGKYFVLVVENDDGAVGIVALAERVEVVAVVFVVVAGKAVDLKVDKAEVVAGLVMVVGGYILVVEMFDNLAGVYEVVDGKNVVFVVESNDEVIINAVVGDDMLVDVGV